MASNGNNGNNSLKIADWEFRRVKEGLDEAQVSSFVSELTGQRDELIQRTEHLSSLTTLAERTVAEDDKLAEEIKVRIVEEANAEATGILAQAETRAQQIEDEAKRIQKEVRDYADVLLSQLLLGVENLKQQIKSLHDTSELKQSCHKDKPREMDVEDKKPIDSQKETIVTNQAKTDELPEEVSPVDDQIQNNNKIRLDMELEILPPLDIMKTMEIITYLDKLPEVENTELIHKTERPSIKIMLHEPINLIDILKKMPVIAHIEEDKADLDGSDGKPPTIQIRLSEESVSPEAS